MAAWTSGNSWIGEVAAVALMTVVVPSGQSLTQTSAGIEVRGTVVDGVSGAPLQDVEVTLVSRLRIGDQFVNERTLTDRRGAFVLWAPAAGEYSLSASRGGRAFGDYRADPFSGSPGWFSLSGRIVGIVVKLWSVPQVGGTVLDENDQPLAGVTVRPMRIITLGDRQVLRPAGGTTTEANGTYSLHVTSLGRYLLAAIPRLRPAGPARSVEYYPGVANASAASPLELAKGQLTTIDFHLERERGFSVSGVLELPPEVEGPNSVELFDVSAEDLPSGFPIATASLSKLGTFTFPPVGPGSYEIRFVRYAAHSPNAVLDGMVRYNDQRRFPPDRLARVPEAQTWWAAERVTVVDKDVTVAVQSKPGVRVTGRMVFEGPGKPPDSAVLPTRGVYLQSVDHRFFRPFQVGSAAEDGTFSTVAVPPGRYVLGVPGPFGRDQSYDGYQLESVRVDGREVAGVSFDLSGDVRDVVLTFSSDATVVMGSVSGKPGQQRFVLAWPEDEALWSGRGTGLGRVAFAQTADGAYRIPLFPGTYRVVALNGVPPQDWESSSYLRSLVGVSERVTLPRGQMVVRHLALASAR